MEWRASSLKRALNHLQRAQIKIRLCIFSVKHRDFKFSIFRLRRQKPDKIRDSLRSMTVWACRRNMSTLTWSYQGIDARWFLDVQTLKKKLPTLFPEHAKLHVLLFFFYASESTLMIREFNVSTLGLVGPYQSWAYI